ncbi:MAG: hypothetical protein HQK50_15695, partial [Oligoflexia bacterium]|nr:hypothetical protein [Oligoflexia bacterium]
MNVTNDKNATVPTILNLDEISTAHVLIIGDRMGKALENYKESIASTLSINTQDTVKIVIAADNHQGLHRSLHLLKQLKKLPPVIVYHGASEELFEKKFFSKDSETILKNIDLYQDHRIQTLLHIFPKISKFLYTLIDRVKMKALPSEDKSDYTTKEAMQALEIGYKLYELELEELIQLAIAKHSQLILMTTPINFEVIPKKICE